MRLNPALFVLTVFTFLACGEPSPSSLAVDRSVLCNGTDTTVTVTGVDFRQTPTVGLAPAGGAPIPVAPSDVTFVDEQHITFIARAALNLQVGTVYDLVVTNPAGGAGTLPAAFTIVPPPALTAVSPAGACDSMGTMLTLTGTLFRDDPMHGPITVTIGAPTPVVLSEASGAVVYLGAMTLNVNVPAGLPDGTWPITVQDQDGCSSTLARGITVAPAPTITSVTPMAGSPATLTIVGTNFAATTTVTISMMGGTPVPLTTTLVNAQTISAVVPATAMAGIYTLSVANGACAATSSIGLPPIQVANMLNPFGCNIQPTPVTINGAGFLSTPSAKLIGAGTAGDLALVNTAFVSSTVASSVVPAGGKIGGPYDLQVLNPDGSHATETMAFTVTKLCPPVISSVTPSSIPHDYNTMATGSSPIVISGMNFRSGATVVLVSSAGTEMMFPGAMVAVTSTQITLNFNAAVNNLTDGIYLVRVKEADDTVGNGGTGATMFGDFSLFIVTNPSGKFQPSATAKALPANAQRRGLAVVGGQNNAAARYLYAVGGDAGGNAPSTLADGYLAPLDVFGHVGAAGWLRLRKRASTPAAGDTFNDLPSARTGLSAEQLNRWVYLVGGTTTVGTGAAPTPTAPLKEVLRAHILSAVDAPTATASTSAGGTLKPGSYYYKVSMLVAAGTAGYGPNAAETVASDEQVVTVAAGQQVQLTFGLAGTSSVPAGQIAGYRIYRSPSPNLATESEQWIADVATTATMSTFVDDGTVSVGTSGAHPLPAGMLSEWESAGTLLIPRAYAAARLATPPGALNPNLYVVGGWSGNSSTGAEKTYELAAVNAAGTLGTFGPTGLAINSATNCTLESCMTAPRWALFADVVTGPASVTAAGNVWLLAGTGALNGTDPIDERVQLLAGGTTGTWAAVPTGPGGAFTTVSTTLGAIGFYSNGYTAISDGYSGGAVSSKEEFGVQTCSGTCTATADFTQTAKSASTLMITPAVAFSGYTITSGYLFVVGGSTTGTNAVANVNQAAQ